MRKTYAFLILLSVAVVAVLALRPSCSRAEEPPAKVDSAPEATSTEGAAVIYAKPTKVTIHIQRNRRNIFTTPHNVSICEDPVFCDGSSIDWVIAGKLSEGETLTITSAPGYPDCFPRSLPVAIQTPNDGAESGPPDESCQEEKYGTFWPYVIEMTLADGTKFGTDPGGIIHRRK